MHALAELPQGITFSKIQTDAFSLASSATAPATRCPTSGCASGISVRRFARPALEAPEHGRPMQTTSTSPMRSITISSKASSCKGRFNTMVESLSNSLCSNACSVRSSRISLKACRCALIPALRRPACNAWSRTPPPLATPQWRDSCPPSSAPSNA